MCISLYRQHRPRPDFLKLKLANRVEVIGGLLGTESGETLLGISGVWGYGNRDIFNEFISQLSSVDGSALVKDLESCFRLYIKTPKLDSGRFNIPKPVIRATLGKSVTDKYGYSVPDLPSYADFIDLRHSIVSAEYIKFSHFKEIYDGIKSYLPVDEVAVLDYLVSDKWFSFSQYRLNYTNWLKSIGVYDSYLDGFDKQKFIRLYRSGKFE